MVVLQVLFERSKIGACDASVITVHARGIRVNDRMHMMRYETVLWYSKTTQGELLLLDNI